MIEKLGSQKFTRRSFIGLGAAALASIYQPGVAGSFDNNLVLSHNQFLNLFNEATSQNNQAPAVIDFKNIMVDAAKKCVLDGGYWIDPSPAYHNYFFARDSYWVLATLRDRPLLEMTQEKFHDDQLSNPDGHIATTLVLGGPKPKGRDCDDESNLVDILREYELFRIGGAPDQKSLGTSFQYILNHLKDYLYVTRGDLTNDADRTNAYHYWADTYRPDGSATPSGQVFSYNQGLLCVALECLEEMGTITDPSFRIGAESAYQQMANPNNSLVLPQREGSNVVDVSSLAGDALSLYYFNHPILSKDKVAATINSFSRAYYPDGQFLGFKVLSSLDGSYRPVNEFIAPESNDPGSYHNGGSWLLKDMLALYSGARHLVPGMLTLMLERVKSSTRSATPFQKARSHEFVYTFGNKIGSADSNRDNYGWNGFTSQLIS